jgi:ABC-type lipoprotein export system ATPase subunit
MTVSKEFNSNIYLFKKSTSGNQGLALNEFISFLKFQKVVMPYRFSFVPKENGLIKDLSLKENLLLDYAYDSLTEEKEVHFKNYLKVKKNVYLEELYNKIINIHERPENSSSEESKIIHLIKSLINDKDFIFLEEPEENLSERSLSTFIKALEIEIKTSNINVFIRTKDENKFLGIISKIVTRSEDYSFKISEKVDTQSFKKERDEFYKVNEKESANFNTLKFHIPKKVSKKPAA